LIDPFDVDVWRRFLELCLHLGRRSEAARQYSRLCSNMRNHFGEDPGFKLSELSSRRFGGAPSSEIRGRLEARR
jgi:DNA-binding SARP family transcriptional activator